MLSSVAFADDVEPAWRAVPRGSFSFGCGDGKPATTKTEVPAFWVTPERVTTAQYQACVAARQCRARPSHRWCDATPSYPATCVTYLQAHRYCRWVGGRLPTEVEWEYVADSGADMNSGAGVDTAHGATEWVIGVREFASQQDNTRGGVADLSPLQRCVGGFADGDLETGNIGFRCVRSTPPGIFPRQFRRMQRTLRRFEVRGKQLALDTKLKDDERARTFVGCKNELRPLGAWVAAKATWQLYETPCTDVAFVITAPDARASSFVPLGRGPKFGDVAVSPACVLTNGTQRTEVPGDWARCDVKLAADLNGDAQPDFLLHASQTCTSAALLLSEGSEWRVAALDQLSCPD